MIIKESVKIDYNDQNTFFEYIANIDVNLVYETIGINKIDIYGEFKKNIKFKYSIIITTDNNDEVFVPSKKISKTHFGKIKKFFLNLKQFDDIKQYFENDLLITLEENKKSRREIDVDLPTSNDNRLIKSIEDVFDNMPIINIFEDIGKNIYPRSFKNVNWKRIVEKKSDSLEYKTKKLYYSDR